VTPNTLRLRNFAAILTTLSGAAQCASLWLLPTTETLLLTAILGAMYLLLALGLFGISRFSLLLAICLLPLRAWSELYPLEIPTWETLRGGFDILIALLCTPVFWASLDHRHEKVPPGLRSAARNVTEDGHP
jgi:hypothetical protein